jgi:hypothetical protein
MVPFGYICWSSLINGDIGLDWALIRLEQPWRVSENIVSLDKDTSVKVGAENSLIHIEEIAVEGPVGRNVLAITGMSGVISGVMSQSPTFMKMPYSKSFQEMWTVRLNENICGSLQDVLFFPPLKTLTDTPGPGDSGAWVIHPSTGNFYGHIVAGCPGSGIAYITPAKHIVRDIWDNLKRELSLPQSGRGLPYKGFTEDKLKMPSSSKDQDLAHVKESQALKAPTATDSAIYPTNSSISNRNLGSSPNDISIIVNFARLIYRQYHNIGWKYLELYLELCKLPTLLELLKYKIDTLDYRGWSRCAGELGPVIGDCNNTLQRLDEALRKVVGPVSPKSDGPAPWDKHHIHSRHPTADEMDSIRIKLINYNASITQSLEMIQLGESRKSSTNTAPETSDVADGIAAKQPRRENTDLADGKEFWKEHRTGPIAKDSSSKVLQQRKVRAVTWIQPLVTSDTDMRDQDVLKAFEREVEQGLYRRLSNSGYESTSPRQNPALRDFVSADLKDPELERTRKEPEDHKLQALLREDEQLVKKDEATIRLRGKRLSSTREEYYYHSRIEDVHEDKASSEDEFSRYERRKFGPRDFSSVDSSDSEDFAKERRGTVRGRTSQYITKPRSHSRHGYRDISRSCSRSRSSSRPPSSPVLAGLYGTRRARQYATDKAPRGRNYSPSSRSRSRSRVRYPLNSAFPDYSRPTKTTVDTRISRSPAIPVNPSTPLAPTPHWEHMIVPGNVIATMFMLQPPPSLPTPPPQAPPQAPPPQASPPQAPPQVPASNRPAWPLAWPKAPSLTKARPPVEMKMVKFISATGKTYLLPFNICETWQVRNDLEFAEARVYLIYDDREWRNAFRNVVVPVLWTRTFRMATMNWLAPMIASSCQPPGRSWSNLDGPSRCECCPCPSPRSPNNYF